MSLLEMDYSHSSVRVDRTLQQEEIKKAVNCGIGKIEMRGFLFNVIAQVFAWQIAACHLEFQPATGHPWQHWTLLHEGS